MKCVLQGNIQRQKISGCQGLRGRGNVEWPQRDMGFSFGGNKNSKIRLWQWLHSCEYPKKY